VTDVRNLGELRDLLAQASQGLEGVAIRRMFGCDGFFAGAEIYGLIWKTGRIGLKLTDPAWFEKAMSQKGSVPWTAGTKTMSHWVLMPESLYGDAAALRSWVHEAHRLALTRSTNPAKPPRAKARKAAS
jgi:TfoX/Sxy family transcriptional regulator of competence genes